MGRLSTLGWPEAGSREEENIQLRHAGVGAAYLEGDIRHLRIVDTGYAAKIEQYCKDLEENWARGLGVYMSGPPMSGKTTLGVEVLRHALRLGVEVAMIEARDIPSIYIDWKRWRTNPRGLNIVEVIEQATFLLIDALDHDLKDWGAGQLTSLLRKRNGNLQPTLVTANIPMRLLVEENVVTRECHSLMEHHLKNVVVHGVDWPGPAKERE